MITYVCTKYVAQFSGKTPGTAAMSVAPPACMLPIISSQFCGLFGLFLLLTRQESTQQDGVGGCGAHSQRLTKLCRAHMG